MARGKRNNNFEFATVQEISEAGRYGGTIMDVIDEGKSYRICVRPYDLDDPNICYPMINGWVPKDNYGRGITQEFIDTFSDITCMDAVIGKKCCVTVEFTEDNSFVSVVGFSKE